MGTLDQLQVDAGKKGSCDVVGGMIVHCVEPIPDNDWRGETWGLYWSDYEDEMRLLLEESTDKYIIKHQEDKHPPLRQHQVTILQCPQSVNPPPPAPSKPTPAPSKPPPSVKLTDIQPPLKFSTLPDTKFSLTDIIPTNSYCNITPTSER